MYQKTVGLIAAGLLFGLGFWLQAVMPDQAWGQWDGEHWQIVGKSWAVLWRGWPLALFGGLVGFLGAGAVLAFSLKQAREADFKAEIARLTRQRDQAVIEAEQRVQARKQAAQERETRALQAQRDAAQAQQEADAMWESAEDFQDRAMRELNQANLRARNAIHAAERIKRRIEGKKRFGAGKSVP